jgi:CO/xanthine dehydrogenase FAD-binding subunit
MKPAPFEYIAPTTLEEALTRLSEYGYEAKALAGGQSLIPMMNFRLAQPAVLIDLNNIPSLANIVLDEQGDLHIGAMARHSQVERHPLVAQYAPLVHETMPHIATHQVRNRGTFGGSIAHADPAAELVAVSVALNSQGLVRWHVHHAAGTRRNPGGRSLTRLACSQRYGFSGDRQALSRLRTGRRGSSR